MAQNNKSGFNYKWTCPEIDKQISDAQDAIRNCLEAFKEELSPYASGRLADNLIRTSSEDLYHTLADIFETVRRTNEDMRGAAENQIEKLEDAVYALEVELGELQEALAEAINGS